MIHETEYVTIERGRMRLALSAAFALGFICGFLLVWWLN